MAPLRRKRNGSIAPKVHKTHRAYLWAYGTTAFADLKGVLYDFTDSRAGRHAKDFLGDWRGTLVCDDYSGYKDLFAQGVTEAGCLAHARRKFFDLQAQQQSPIAGEALEHLQQLYRIEREAAPTWIPPSGSPSGRSKLSHSPTPSTLG